MTLILKQQRPTSYRLRAVAYWGLSKNPWLQTTPFSGHQPPVVASAGIGPSEGHWLAVLRVTEALAEPTARVESPGGVTLAPANGSTGAGL